MNNIIITKQYPKISLTEVVGSGKFKAGDKVSWKNKSGQIKTGIVLDEPVGDPSFIKVQFGSTRAMSFAYNENAFSLSQPQAQAQPQANIVPRGTNVKKVLNELYNEMNSLFKFIVSNRGQVNQPTEVEPAQPEQEPTDYSYEGKPVKLVNIPGVHILPYNVGIQFSNGNTIQVKRSAVKGLTSEGYYSLSEGKYIKDKNVTNYLNKSLSNKEIKTFEGLMFRVELIRNQLRKLDNTGNKVVDSYVQKFKENPIVATDFDKMFNIASTNPQDYENFLKFINVVNNRLYTGTFKGDNIVNKMSSLGKMSFNESDTNGFNKSAQSKKAFKENLFNFITTLMEFYQYLTKMRKQAAVNATRPPRKQPVQPTTETITENKLITEEIQKIKKIINYTL